MPTTIGDLLSWSQIRNPSANFNNRTLAIPNVQQAIDIVGDDWSAFRRTIILQPHLGARENILLSFLRMTAAALRDLVFVNTQLIDNRVDIPANAGSLVGLKTAWPMVQIHHPHLRKYYAKRGDTRLRDFIALTAPVAHRVFPASTVQILTVIGTAVNEITSSNVAYDGRFDEIARGHNGLTIGIICRLYALHPPGSAFGGFAGWGNGNHTSPSMNIRFHFLKHVLFIDSEGGLTENSAQLLIATAGHATAQVAHQAFDLLTEEEEGTLATPDECADWWRTLNIVLPRSQCMNLIADDDKDKFDVLRLWCSGVSLSAGYVVDFVRCGVIQRNPALLAWLIEHYEAAYRDHAIRCSRRLNDIVISSNGEKVFVAGTNGDDFVIGRLDNDTGVLGISSCYRPAVPADKMKSHHTHKLWTLN